MPCVWDLCLVDNITKNYNLSKSLLLGNFRKLKYNSTKLELYDDVIKKQLQDGVIKLVDNTQSIVQNKETAFLGHSGVFTEKDGKLKCRVVYLSNLKENATPGFSHNDASVPGANYNSKLSFALSQLRFDKYVIIFDLVKAFLQIQIAKSDQNKLYFLWFKDVHVKSPEIQIFKFLRLPFGLRFSPSMLMTGLQIILLKDTEGDCENLRELKKAIYNVAYMDNLGYSTNDVTNLKEAYRQFESIFGKYKFELQEFASNNEELQETFETALGSEKSNCSRLFGINWNRVEDTLYTNKLFLNNDAYTKRSILASIHSNFDPLGQVAPLLNRARLFLHGLQCDQKLSWDSELSEDLVSEWKKICNQINSTEFTMSIPRFVGNRNSNYDLIAFVDSSKQFYGTVIFLREISSGKVSFVLGRNRIVSAKLAEKSIPLLELTSIELGVNTLMDLYKQFISAVIPIKISALRLFSDSSVSLSWLRGKTHTFTKVERKSIYLNNRLSNIIKSCELKPIHFGHVAGDVNPSDMITRCVSLVCFVNPIIELVRIWRN
jgi:hypothetical protein